MTAPGFPPVPGARMSTTPAMMPRVVLGVSGGIAAYKSCELVRRLRTSRAGRALLKAYRMARGRSSLSE